MFGERNAHLYLDFVEFDEDQKTREEILEFYTKNFGKREAQMHIGWIDFRAEHPKEAMELEELCKR